MRAYPTAESQRPLHRVVRVTAADGSQLDDAEPEWTGDPRHYQDRIVGVVRIEGPINLQRGPEAAWLSANSAFDLIDDASSEVLAWGMP